MRSTTEPDQVAKWPSLSPDRATIDKDVRTEQELDPKLETRNSKTGQEYKRLETFNQVARPPFGQGGGFQVS